MQAVAVAERAQAAGPTERVAQAVAETGVTLQAVRVRQIRVVAAADLTGLEVLAA